MQAQQPQQQLQQLTSQVSSYPLAFIIDIDGTLTISHKEILGSSQALNFLTNNKIPFLLLTNNISRSQQTLARQISNLLRLNEPIKGQQVILNYTPTKEAADWENITVLLIGREVRFDQILPIKHIPKYATIEEYCAIFPNDVPLGRREVDQRAQRIKKNVQQRLGLEQITKQTLQFGAILIICCPTNWQQSLQVIMDILNSSDGSFPLHKKSYTYQKTHIPIMATNNDLLYMTKDCNLPRILIRPFNQMVKSTFKEVFGQELEMKIFGKPQIDTYRFTERHCQKIFGKIGKYVMIGDNPEIDVQGAVNAGWDGILLKSGVAKNDLPCAKVNCTHLLSGIQEYLQKFGKKLTNLP